MKSILIHHHLGLGDHIICNGLVREILNRENPSTLYLPVKEHNLFSVSRMYKDEDKIKCIPVKRDADVCHLKECKEAEKVIKVGFEKVRKDWDVSFYDSVGIPFEKRWSMFKCFRDTENESKLESIMNPHQESFILVHDTGSNISYDLKFQNKGLKIIKVQPLSNCMMDWCSLIEKAVEIHCIDSSFIHLCQSLGVPGFLERGFKNNMPFMLLPSWKMNYDI